MEMFLADDPPDKLRQGFSPADIDRPFANDTVRLERAHSAMGEAGEARQVFVQALVRHVLEAFVDRDGVKSIDFEALCHWMLLSRIRKMGRDRWK